MFNIFYSLLHHQPKGIQEIRMNLRLGRAAFKELLDTHKYKDVSLVTKVKIIHAIYSLLLCMCGKLYNEKS